MCHTILINVLNYNNSYKQFIYSLKGVIYEICK